MRTIAVRESKVTGPMRVTQTLNDNILSKKHSDEPSLIFFPPCHSYSSLTDILIISVMIVNPLIQFIVRYNLIL